MITRLSFNEALWIATGCNAHIELDTLYDRGTKRPSRKVFTTTAYLVGMFLACDEYGNVKLRKVAKILESLPSEWLRELGMDSIDEHQLYRYSARLTKSVDYTLERAPHLTTEEQHWRAEQLTRFSDALLATTLIDRPPDGRDYAIDSTGIWSNNMGQPITKSTSEDDLDEDHIQSSIESEKMVEHGIDTNLSEAHWGYKTRKRGGTQMFFGFDLHALIRVPAQQEGGSKGLRPEPSLAETISLVPAGSEIVEPSLSLIDRVLATGQSIRFLLADRHYSHKKAARWRLPLAERGIRPVVDMRKDDQGFRLHDSVPWAAGQPHCPKVPSRLGDIPTLAPNATHDQRVQFNESTADRRKYAAKIHTPIDREGKVRFQCPALDNRIGCPLRPGTVATAHEHSLPIIINPPELLTAPKICTQSTFTVKSSDPQDLEMLKHHQNPVWGSPEWRTLYRRRTYVEGWFGTLKDTVGLRRRNIRVNGIAMNTIAVSVFAAVANKRHLQSWDRETNLGDKHHPLLSRYQMVAQVA